MSSITTKICKNIKKRLGTFEGTPQYTVFHEGGGYSTVHPTKGWKHISATRIRARERMMQQFGFIR